MPSWARFDEGYVHGFEDFELCRRFRRMGLPVQVLSTLRCVHPLAPPVIEKPIRAVWFCWSTPL